MPFKDEAFHLLRQLFQQHTARWQQTLNDVTKPQYAVMCAISEHPGIEQVALTDAAVSTKATLAELLSRMEQRGLVRRENDPVDKRRKLIWLTKKGEALLAAAKPKGETVDKEFLDRLSEKQKAEFVALIVRMLDK